MKGRPAKHKKLLEDPEVKQWYQQLAMDSKNTAEERLRVLGRVCGWWNTTPAKLASLATDPNGGRRAVEDMLINLMFELKQKRKSAGYRKNIVKAVKSWLLHNEVALIRKIHVGDDGQMPDVDNERIPTKKELQGALQAASDRGRVEIALSAFSFVRLEVEGMEVNGGEMDGLRIRDIEGLKVDGGRVTFSIIPAMITVRRELSKIKKQYITFIGPQGCGYLKSSLERRMAKREVLMPDSPVVRVGFDREKGGRPVGGAAYGSPFLTTSAIRSEVRAALRTQKPTDGAREFRPHVLRSYGDTNLEIAEREGKITPDDRKLFMGRKGDIDRLYTTGKRILPPKVIDQLRGAYRRCLPYLETTSSSLEVLSLPEKERLEAEKVLIRQELLQEVVEEAKQSFSRDIDRMIELRERIWLEQLSKGGLTPEEDKLVEKLKKRFRVGLTVT